MALYETRTVVGREAFLSLFNGVKVASGYKPPTGDSTGLTSAAASADVSGPTGVFADVEVGDRFYIDGVSTEFTVDAKTDDENLTLDAVAGIEHLADSGTWRAYRGPRIAWTDVKDVEADFEGQRYTVTYELGAEFGP